ncbi:uncharacterized protein LOC135493634 [Lineus longissimus]|uniref:uncharacterized protein LOC135493634 n=1 Tax=Lineus longissimus TaxID=88925 RepID=UPI002B4F7D43
MAASEEAQKPVVDHEAEGNDCKPSTSGANEEELERIATEELLREAKRGAERVREMGIFGWQKSPVPPVNKRFLNNTLSSTLRHPFKKKRGRSRSPRENSNGHRPSFPDWGDDRRRRTRFVDKNDIGDGDPRHGPGPEHHAQSKDLENIRPDNKQNSWDSPDMNIRKRTRSHSPSVNGKLRKKSKSDKKRSKSNRPHSRTRSKNKSDKSRSKRHKSSSRKKDKDKDKDKDKSKKSKSKHKHESKHNGKHEKKRHSHKSKHRKDKKHKK